MKKILFVAFAWISCVNLGFAFGELRWHKCENIVDDKRQDSALRWRKCGNAGILESLDLSLRKSEANEAIQDSHNNESNITRDSFFAGIELGYMHFEYKESSRIGTTNPNNTISRGVVDMGILWGYRHFFSDSVGIRGFVSMNYRYGNVGGFGELKMLNLGINADFLLNFYASNAFDFGAFFGLSFGGDIFAGGGVNRIKNSIDDYKANLSSPAVGFNLGIQSVVLNKIGIEFVAKIPLLSHYFLNAGDGELNSITRKFSQNYSLGARVIYHF